MKAYYKQPVREIRMVKPNENEDYFEFWLITPVKIGSVTKRAHKEFVGEDGGIYPTATAAMQAAIDARGGMGEQAAPSRQVTVRFTGFDLVERGKWAEFCKLRGLNTRSTDDMSKVFQLNKHEMEAIGL